MSKAEKAAEKKIQTKIKAQQTKSPIDRAIL
jgi:hypothetical protein